ncbi:MAG: FGGY-family carbohydrate kinase, partial [Anaerolineae bacterium]
MSLLGIDIGTTGCKTVLFNTAGQVLASAYAEYDVQRPQPGWAELDTAAVWAQVKDCIRAAAHEAGRDPIQALAVCSLGEAVVPLAASGEILGPSLLNFDARGAEFLPELGAALAPEHLYSINGNTLGNHFSLTKLLWIKRYQPDLYAGTNKFMHWGGLVGSLLGAETRLDYSLANRSLLFDLAAGDWSDELLHTTGLERDKLPVTVPSGTAVGEVSRRAADELGLPAGVTIVSGAHDQCANAVGAGVISPGQAMYGMGTYICIVPVFHELRDSQAMIARGLNTEHHAAPGSYVSFIYNQGGALLKWYRDTFAPLEKRLALDTGKDIYSILLKEMPVQPSSVLALPHFTVTGPPDFISDSAGVLAGLRLETERGDILKGLLEGATYYLRESIETLPGAGIPVESYVAVGGGSKSDTWIQLSADILQRPFSRPRVTEAGALGAAILAGAGCGVFSSVAEGVGQMVQLDTTFEPNEV